MSWVGDLTGWQRGHARRALGTQLALRVVRPRAPVYGSAVVAAFRVIWVVLGALTGMRVAPVLPDLVARLRRFGELTIPEQTAASLTLMSAATIDCRLAADRAEMSPRRRSLTRPRPLLKDSILIRNWTQWDDADDASQGHSHPPSQPYEWPAIPGSPSAATGPRR